MLDVRSFHNILYNQLNGYDSHGDYYDPDRGIRVCEEIDELLKHHISKDECEAEIEIMKGENNKLLHSLFESFPQLPSHCTAKIFSYLSNKDLRILIHAFKPLNSPNTYISDVENPLVVKGRHTE